jgi:hypothetical protein
MIGLILGIAGGTALMFALTFLLAQREQKIHIDIASAESEVVDEGDLRMPLDKQLRNSIYECEQNIKTCKSQIEDICNEQLDLLKDVGKISHVEVKNKPLFFEFYNPTNGQRFFYYERDISKKIDPEVLASTQKIAQKYTQQIDLLSTQQELFKKMITSNLENLDRIKGIKREKPQSEKIRIHEKKLTQLHANNSLEQKAIYNELILNDIQDELAHQEECLRQYSELNQKYSNPFDENLGKKYKIEILEIIQQLEADA